jgi:hypothetical protein
MGNPSHLEQSRRHRRTHRGPGALRRVGAAVHRRGDASRHRLQRRLESRHKHGIVAPVAVMAVALTLVAGVSWGAPPQDSTLSGSRTKPTATATVTKTVTATATVTMAGPTMWTTATATVPGPTTTVTAPGPTKTVTAAGPTSTVTVPGPTTTVTVPGATSSAPPTTSAPTSAPPTTGAPTSTATATTTATASQTPTNPPPAGDVCTSANAWTDSWTKETYDWVGENSGSMGEYYVSSDMWGAGDGSDMYQHSTFCSRTSDGNSPYWAIQARTLANADGSVKSYPNAHMDYHHWGTDAEPSVYDVDGNPATPNTLTSTFAHQGPGSCPGCSYDWAQELWLNQYAVEVMIWTDWKTQDPGWVSDYVETVTVDGRSWKVYHAVWGGTGTSRDGYIVFLPANGQPITSGTFNDMAFIKYLDGKGWIGPAPTLSQVTYGVEICTTAGATMPFTVSNFSVTPLPHLVY